MPRVNALTAVSPLINEGKALLAQGDSYYAQAGAKFLEAREAAGGFTLQYKLALREHGVGLSTERRAIQFAQNPVAELEHKQRERSRDASRTRRSGPERDAPSPNNDLPKTAGNDGIHEAVQGFKAATLRMRKARRAGEAAKALDWHTVALQHFKFLVTRSNLPAVSGMSVDEIIATLTF